jgi:hypothetical protein
VSPNTDREFEDDHADFTSPWRIFPELYTAAFNSSHILFWLGISRSVEAGHWTFTDCIFAEERPQKFCPLRSNDKYQKLKQDLNIFQILLDFATSDCEKQMPAGEVIDQISGEIVRIHR